MNEISPRRGDAETEEIPVKAAGGGAAGGVRGVLVKQLQREVAVQGVLQPGTHKDQAVTAVARHTGGLGAILRVIISKVRSHVQLRADLLLQGRHDAV